MFTSEPIARSRRIVAYRILLLLACVTVPVLAWGFFQQESTATAKFNVVIIMLLILVPLGLITMREFRLEITIYPEGVVYRNLWGSRQIEWLDIVRVTTNVKGSNTSADSAFQFSTGAVVNVLGSLAGLVGIFAADTEPGTTITVTTEKSGATMGPNASLRLAPWKAPRQAARDTHPSGGLMPGYALHGALRALRPTDGKHI